MKRPSRQEVLQDQEFKKAGNRLANLPKTKRSEVPWLNSFFDSARKVSREVSGNVGSGKNAFYDYNYPLSTPC